MIVSIVKQHLFRRLSLATGLLAFPTFAHAAESIDEIINSALAPLTAIVSAVIFYSVPVLGAQLPLVVLWLIAGTLFFTAYFGCINFRGFKHAFRLARGDYSDPAHPGEVSHFQALATAVSGTVGIGNIGGVAVENSIGGPGATLWLIVAGLLGMSTKFVECALGT